MISITGNQRGFVDLDMHKGELTRLFEVVDGDGRTFSILTRRFVSKARRELACISYKITLEDDPTNKGAAVTFTPYLDGNIVNEDANYGEDFWQALDQSSAPGVQLVTMETKKSGFVVAAASSFSLYLNDQEVTDLQAAYTASPRYAQGEISTVLQRGDSLRLEKVVAVTTSRDHPARQYPSGHWPLAATQKALQRTIPGPRRAMGPGLGGQRYPNHR